MCDLERFSKIQSHNYMLVWWVGTLLLCLEFGIISYWHAYIASYIHGFCELLSQADSL